MKYLDMYGTEFKVGDFVAYATSCTGTGHLRRGLVTREISESPYWNKSLKKTGVQLKSIIPSIDVPKYGYNPERQYVKLGIQDVVVVGNCSRTVTLSAETPPESIQFKEIIRLGDDYKKVFSEREQVALQNCKTKLIP